jgi:transposase
LPQPERAVVEAVCIAGDSYRAVAKRHKVSHEAVRNWTKAGLARLRPQLERCL